MLPTFVQVNSQNTGVFPLQLQQPGSQPVLLPAPSQFVTLAQPSGGFTAPLAPNAAPAQLQFQAMAPHHQSQQLQQQPLLHIAPAQHHAVQFAFAASHQNHQYQHQNVIAVRNSSNGLNGTVLGHHQVFNPTFGGPHASLPLNVHRHGHHSNPPAAAASGPFSGASGASQAVPAVGPVTAPNGVVYPSHSPYAIASRTIPPMRLTAAGNFRLQMSHTGITDSNAAGFLEYARDQLLEAYRATPQGAAKAAQLGRELEFKDVPVVEVTLNRNTLTDAALPCVVDFIRSNEHIASLEVLSNRLTDACAPILAELARSSKLERLKIGDNMVTSVGAKIIASGLDDGNSKLMQLHLSGNKIGDEGVTHVARACSMCPIEVLGLREVAMGDAGWGAVGEMVAASTAVVKELHLKGNTMSDAAAHLFVEPIAGPHALGITPAIKVLALPHCSISPRACVQLCRALSRCSNLVQLDISSNPIGDEGGLSVAQWFAAGDCPQLVSLSLSRTEISLPTIQALLTGPGGNPPSALQNLTSIDISFNLLPDDAAGATIDRLLRSATSLLTFAAYHCHLSTPAVANICRAIADHQTLTDIDFSSNFSCDENAAAWAAIVGKSARLERLILTDNQMGAPSIDGIVTAMRDSPLRNLSFVQIGGQSKTPPTRNVVPQSVQSMLSEVLVRNRREDAAAKRGELPLQSATDTAVPSPPNTGAQQPVASVAGSRARGNAGNVGGGASALPSPADLRRALGYPAPPPLHDPRTERGGITGPRPTPKPSVPIFVGSSNATPVAANAANPQLFGGLAHHGTSSGGFVRVVSVAPNSTDNIAWYSPSQAQPQQQASQQQAQPQQQPQQLFVMMPGPNGQMIAQPMLFVTQQQHQQSQ